MKGKLEKKVVWELTRIRKMMRREAEKERRERCEKKGH